MAAERIFLIGMMGSGKSHWLKQMAKWNKSVGYDLDALIEMNEEKTIAELFNEDGEAYFRKAESKILKWFKETPNAILTSVSILTTGFDEPTVESIILNRATKSLTLYYQMIGRGSRILKNKNSFDVIDLGVQVPPEKFVAAIIEHKPDIVGMSAFLTTTMPMFKVNIHEITKAGLRDQVIIMVGGAPVTQEYADVVGADGFAADASTAVRIAKDLIAKKRASVSA